jgi:hypothetical protein
LPSYLGWFRALNRQPVDGWKPAQWLAIVCAALVEQHNLREE